LAGTSADTDLGEAVLARAVPAYRAALGSRLIAGYALGSLAHGGFSALVSDVDLGLILHDPVTVKDRMTIRAVAHSVKAGGSALDQRLSVFWGTPATLGGQRRGGRFPLYVQYIDDHIARLGAGDRHRLAGRFRRWRTRLLAGS
jgi:hypothetical protein